MEFEKNLKSIQEAGNLAVLGNKAAEALAEYSAEQIDRIIKNMVRVGEEHAIELAEMAVEETGFGIVDDKVHKNHMATGMLYESIKDMKTVEIINEDDEKKTVELAVPVKC